MRRNLVKVVKQGILYYGISKTPDQSIFDNYNLLTLFPPPPPHSLPPPPTPLTGGRQYQQVSVSTWQRHHGTRGHSSWQVEARPLPRLQADIPT